jgi:TonB-dependent starch-binding outer membrane protein SusC
MKRILLIKVMLLLVLMGEAWAQTRTVTGKVTDGASGQSLPGVTVMVKGSNTGASTDIDGQYSIAVPENRATLVYTFIGYNKVEKTVGNATTINVTLQVDAKQLSEVVVVGYGTQERRDVTGSITTVSGESLKNLVTPSFDQQLAGRAPGLQVTQPSGVLGAAPTIRIRGTNSLSSGADPLIVIDGVPVFTGNQGGVNTPTNALGDLNPADIESYEVLKDGSATAIYGSRAANGVILITTKKGKAGQMTVNYDNYLGINKVAKRFDLLNAAEFVEIANEKMTNAGETPQAVASGIDTDWQDQVYRQGFAQNHNLSFAGGSEKSTYYFSLGYTDQQGALVANSLKRYSFRSNLDHQVKDWLKVGANLSFNRTETQGLNTNTIGLSSNVIAATRALPNVSPFDAANVMYDGFNVSPNGAALGQGSNGRLVENNYSNIAFVLKNNKFLNTAHRTLSNVYAELKPLQGLTLRTQFGVDLLSAQDFNSWDKRHGDGRGPGYVFQYYLPNTRWNWQNTLTYDKTIAQQHKVNFVGGVEYQKSRNSWFFATGQGFSDIFFQQQALISGTYTTQLSGGNLTETGFDSYFGRINYSFADKYLLSIAARNDGISSLPLANRRGTFPGGSLGWRVSEEGFFKNIPLLADHVSEFKLRGSYAVVGNVDIGAYPYLGTYGAAQVGDVSGIIFTNTGNPELQWEQSKKLDAGFDLTLLGGRISLNADYFRNDVDNLVLFAPTPPSLGVPGNGINQNIGAMVNQGVELRLVTANIEREDFSWTTDFNYTRMRNEITALNNNADMIFSYNINRVGESIGSLYGFRSAGVNPANGNPMFYKANGTIVQGNIANTTYYTYDPANPNNFSDAAKSSLTNTDKTLLGNTTPTFMGGMTNTFKYKGLDLEVFLRYAGGNKIMNVSRQDLLNMGFANNGREILNRWKTEGQVTDVPKIWYGRENIINQSNNAIDRFVENGDFLRVQNIALGYRIPQHLISKTGANGLRSLRIFAQVQNAFTFTKYQGLDPELNALTNSGSNLNRNSQFGVDFSTNPIIRSFTAGINLGL